MGVLVEVLDVGGDLEISGAVSWSVKRSSEIV